jgi:hypothetical protein
MNSHALANAVVFDGGLTQKGDGPGVQTFDQFFDFDVDFFAVDRACLEQRHVVAFGDALDFDQDRFAVGFFSLSPILFLAGMLYGKL